MKLKLLLLVLVFVGASSEFGSDDTSRINATETDYMGWIEKMSSFKQKLITQKGNKKFNPCKTIKVSKRSRLATFQSVQKAINSIPLVNNCRVVIHIGKGTYREKVEIPATMAYITLEGAGAKKTRIVWDDTADKTGKDGQPLHTYGSATFAVNSPYFIAKNITFKNKAPLPPSGALGKQAVALRVSADMATFINCRIVGAQDTLYDFNGRHYFKNCYVRGSVDFIFGNGLSLYENCHLHGVTNTYGSLTAQRRDSLLEETGFSFVNCKVTGSGAFYLGRAWGTFSRVVFAYTYMGEIIASSGWYNWGDKNREMTVYYGQYKCSGPGAEYRGRVPWSRELTDQEAAPFISTGFIDGQEWLPSSH